ncbi:thyroid receptor-interacting protein 6 isoform X2 [Lagenorhynchus albirostris]|uniref:thyroid receptor-interacting protein 6 isoform X2 n=1 Tax=Lagenorhynchus albirostris TaxID=27610 RepID=UPI0028E4E6D3|nr:thyroid receptor-interacting protein 6 isoform X2 [Lagenorhynchus albirostris]
MSGPTWLTPKQPEPARAPQGRGLPRGASGPPAAHGAALQPHPRVNFCPLPSEQCYQAPGGPEDRGLAWVGCHGATQRSQGLPADRGGLRPGSLDAEIDSLTSMLAELDGGRGHAPRRPDRQAYEPPQPPAYRSGSGSLKPNGGGVPPPPLPASPYGGPTPASYATASTPAGPAFPVQVKVAQPVRGCGPPRRGASQASGPLPGPHFPLPGRGEVWGAGYRSHREPGPGGKEEAAGVSSSAGGRGGGYGSQAGVVAVEKMWSGMGPGSWPWTASFTLAALCVLRAGPSSGASISTPWREGHIVRAAMWPPWRSAPRAPSPSWTGFCGLWGRPTTLAASPVWCATAASTASLSLWMPPARSTALRTSTGSLPQDAQCVVGPSCLSQVRRRPCES